jgi:hypothetical protein
MLVVIVIREGSKSYDKIGLSAGRAEPRAKPFVCRTDTDSRGRRRSACRKCAHRNNHQEQPGGTNHEDQDRSHFYALAFPDCTRMFRSSILTSDRGLQSAWILLRHEAGYALVALVILLVLRLRGMIRSTGPVAGSNGYFCGRSVARWHDATPDTGDASEPLCLIGAASRSGSNAS